ncbi:MAG: FkbM family methyltransferase [Actinobacteria bacterium]|nr:MAG: FkbM family methyltransferase [Actinomycetota bacterium]
MSRGLEARTCASWLGDLGRRAVRAAPPGTRDAIQVARFRSQRMRDSIRLRRFRWQGHPESATAGDVRACYRLLLGREPDERGLCGHIHKIASRPTPVDELVTNFVSSPEFRQRLQRTFAFTTGTPEPVDLHAGFRLYVRPDDAEVGEALRNGRAYEEHVTRRLTDLLSPGSVFVDIGASLGFYTVLAGRLVGPSGRVISCEPGPQNHSVLLLNIVTNHLDNVDLFPLAVSDGPSVLFYSRSGGNGVIERFDGDPRTLGVGDLVEAKALDRLIDPDLQVDVMKVDVEGAEGQVLRGAEKTIRRCSPTIFFEFSPPALEVRSGMTGIELLRLLASFGYSFEILMPDGASVPVSSPEDVMRVFNENTHDHLDVMARAQGAEPRSPTSDAHEPANRRGSR